MKPNQYSVSELRRANRNRVYRYLYESMEPQTTQDVARALSMSLPTVNQNLSELLDMGLIDNSKIAPSNGGRRPRVLSIIPEARYAIGAEISHHHIRIVAVDLEVRELGYQSVERRFSVSDDYARGLAHDIEVFIKKFSLDRDKLLGIGITFPGIVNAEQGIVVYAPTLQLHQQSIGLLTRYIPYEVSFCNDANAGGFAEWWNQPDLTSMAYLSLGRGIGGAILINGAPYEGLHQRSGEFGHMCIHPGGKPCACGRQGCLEAYCSTAVLSHDLGITLEEFFQSLEAGDETNTQLWDRYLNDLAIGILNIHTALDCNVVLGGQLTQYAQDQIREIVEKMNQIDASRDTSGYFQLCRFHEKSNGIGAALQFIDSFLSSI